MKREPQVVNKRVVYGSADGDKTLSVIEASMLLPNGTRPSWRYVEITAIVAGVPVVGGGNVYLINEWRFPAEKWLLQIPAGSIAKNLTEKQRIEHAGKELREEVGLYAQRIKPLYRYNLGGARVDSTHYIYLARGLSSTLTAREDHELIKVRKMPLVQARRLLSDNPDITLYTRIGLEKAEEALAQES